MDIVAWIQILDETFYISYGTNILRKGMYPTILPQAMSK